MLEAARDDATNTLSVIQSGENSFVFDLHTSEMRVSYGCVVRPTLIAVEYRLIV